MDHLIYLQVSNLLDTLRSRNGLSDAENARALVGQFGEHHLEEVVRTRRNEAERILRGPELPSDWTDTVTVFGDPDGEPWYLGPRDGHRDLWDSYCSVLRARGWDPTVPAIDEASTDIVARLGDPTRASFTTKGLVVGNVQSGKTANFAAVAAKAADEGYRVILVLSGLTNLLRYQTQVRLVRDLIGTGHTKNRWVVLTDDTLHGDFGGMGPDHTSQNPNALMSQAGTYRYLGVVKKIKSRLDRLIRWFASVDEAIIKNVPVLIVDDEADQASVNCSSDEAEPSTINRLVRELIGLFPRVSYVGYTATPYANVFIDPEAPSDLYPRDFIVSLPRTEGYFGAERIFGRMPAAWDEADSDTDGMDIVREVPENEAQALRGDSLLDPETQNDGLPESLLSALRYFLAVSAVRATGTSAPPASTMMIHTTMLADPQHELGRRVESALEQLADLSDQEISSNIVNPFRWELTRTEHSPKQMPTITRVRQCIRDCQVVVENYRAEPWNRLHEIRRSHRTLIVVGGNVLGRGLTLDGLVVSYFVRGGTAYDTLLQMGRWFGYRHGYEHLPRLWMTDELRSYFYDLAFVEVELKEDIKTYEAEGLTPGEYGVRVRTHPYLAITSRAKMGKAELCYAGYSERRIQTIHFDRSGPNVAENLDALRLAVPKWARYRATPAIETQHILFSGVPNNAVLSYLESYRPHENAAPFANGTLAAYIRRESAAGGSINSWNVVLYSLQSADGPTLLIDAERGIEVRPMGRSRLKGFAHANIKGLMSAEDYVLDLIIAGHYEAADNADFAALKAARRDLAPGVGLLVVYVIDKDSQPPAVSTTRQPMDASHHLVGLGLAFPRSGAAENAVEYMSVDLSGMVQENPTFDLDEATS